MKNKNLLYVLMLMLFAILYLFIDLYIINNNTINNYESLRLSCDKDYILEILSKDKSLLQEAVEREAGKVIHVTATVYNPIKQQTDSTPHITADNSHINLEYLDEYKIIAISRDLHKRYGGKFSFGDQVIVYSSIDRYNGIYVVSDLMHERYTKSIDFYVSDDSLSKFKASIRKIN